MTSTTENQRFLFRAIVTAFLIIAGVTSRVAEAQTRSEVYGSALDRQTPTAFAGADLGLATTESGIAASNASSKSLRTSGGIYAGESRSLGIFLRNSETSMNFKLNGNSSRTTFRDLHSQARLWWFYPSLVVSLSEMAVNRDGQRFVDLYGTGVGGALGVHAPVLPFLELRADVTYIKTPHARDQDNARSVKLGDRLEVDVGTTFDLILKYVDLNVGYVYRSHQVTVDDVTYSEKTTMPYAGLRAGVYF